MSRKIYTKTGDAGKTGLVSGQRVSKDHARLHLYGQVDELNAYIGLVVALEKEEEKKSCVPKNKDEENRFLEFLQGQLLVLGGLLACESSKWEKYKLPKLDKRLVPKLEEQIDEMTKELPPLKNFILPGGNVLAAQVHILRCKSRNVERQLVSFSEAHPDEVPEGALAVLNRLSDYFFTFARYVTKKGQAEEILWKVERT